MAEPNRYLNLIDELKKPDEPASKPVTEKPKKAKAKTKRAKKEVPTKRSEDDPKMRRVGSGGLAKSKHPDYEKGTYYLPKTTTHRMRVHAVNKQIELSDLVDIAVRQYLENHPL